MKVKYYLGKQRAKNRTVQDTMSRPAESNSSKGGSYCASTNKDRSKESKRTLNWCQPMCALHPECTLGDNPSIPTKLTQIAAGYTVMVERKKAGEL